MTMRDVSVSSSARSRIRSFSVWVWIAGAAALAVGALNTFADVGLGEDGFAMIADNENPWEVANPPVFEPDGVSYAGEGSGLIRIPRLDHDQAPYAVQLIAGDYLDLYMTEAADLDRPADDRGYPTSLGYLYDSDDDVLVLPPDADLELWVRTDAPWSFTLQKAEVVEMTDGFASGTGNDFLVYRGDAVSARFVHKGEGIFYVTVQTRGERRDQPIIESGEVDQRLSWDPTDAVYISIEADDDRGAWSVDIDELAPENPDAAASPRGTP
ncbi:hypothetical protein D6T64_13810 [Cryobacterium melibiosiphilum]|uniref:Uncharacterized protein n=1 Tax=Cryobacterium melibiosiphilum TaxID=995039 RepID=A0A3A5MC23_9MICO|nr:hypothetical protein [Cryobacterium melibiosiphilum]RJT87670.1 hypothetical protein D6T64_13810 [Cryobacterium melibiosiphilum]